jgi:hypothetical protein
VLIEASQAWIQMGELDKASELARTAMTAASQAGDEVVVMVALGTLGQIHRRRLDFAQALTIARGGHQRALGTAPRLVDLLASPQPSP